MISTRYVEGGVVGRAERSKEQTLTCGSESVSVSSLSPFSPRVIEYALHRPVNVIAVSDGRGRRASPAAFIPGAGKMED